MKFAYQFCTTAIRPHINPWEKFMSIFLSFNLYIPKLDLGVSGNAHDRLTSGRTR